MSGKISTPLFGVLCLAVALAGFAFTLHASFPGYLNADSGHQLEQALSWTFNDWHSPTVVVVWALLMKLMPGPVSFIVFDNLLIWGAALALALAMRNRLGAWSLMLVAMPLFPGVFNYLGNVHVDVMLVAWLMAAASLGFFSRREGVSPRARLVLHGLAIICLVMAFLTRLNSIFALIPLLLYVNARLGRRRNVILTAVLVMAMPVLYKAQNAALDVTKGSPSESIKVYNLLALSYYERRNLMPGEWTEQQSRDIVNACYSPVQWDTAWTGNCGFIFDQLQRQQLWGSMALTQAWLREIVSHPAGYFTVLAATFKRSVFEPNSRAMLFKVPNRWNWEVADNPRRVTTDVAERYIRSSLNDKASRPWFFALISAVAVVVLFRTRVVTTEEGHFALAVLASGLVFLLTYFLFNPSAEYRYFYWCGFASYMGFLIAMFARRPDRQGALRSDMKVSGPLRATALGIGALAASLIMFPLSLPMSYRVVAVIPLDARPVSILGIHDAATPKWMQEHFQGGVAPMAWTPSERGYRSSQPLSPFVVYLKTLRQDIEVVLATSPGLGRAAIESAGFRRVVDTDSGAAPADSISIKIPQGEAGGVTAASHAMKNAAVALAIFLLCFALMSRLANPCGTVEPGHAATAGNGGAH